MLLYIVSQFFCDLSQVLYGDVSGFLLVEQIEHFSNVLTGVFVWYTGSHHL